MNLLEYYYKKIIIYDLINKFSYKNLKKIPKLKRIVLNFGCRNSEIKILAASLVSLELIAVNNNITLTKSKKANIFIKIRSGHPIGCKVVLKGKKMYNFFFKFISDILPSLKEFKGIILNKKNSFESFSFTLKELIVFKELETNFYLFNNLPPLNINIITNTKTKKELVFLINSFKIPILNYNKTSQ
jgi:large subunit ribosomal protein L5